MRLKLPNPEGELAYIPWNVVNQISGPLRVDWVVLIWEVALRCEEMDLGHHPASVPGFAALYRRQLSSLRRPFPPVLSQPVQLSQKCHYWGHSLCGAVTGAKVVWALEHRFSEPSSIGLDWILAISRRAPSGIPDTPILRLGREVCCRGITLPWGRRIRLTSSPRVIDIIHWMRMSLYCIS